VIRSWRRFPPGSFARIHSLEVVESACGVLALYFEVAKLAAQIRAMQRSLRANPRKDYRKERNNQQCQS
jgi:hypothetical protein